MSTHWTLCVDESGDEFTSSTPMVLAGVLLPAGAQFDVENMRRRVAECFPAVVYPPHATELRHVSSLVAQAAFAQPSADAAVASLQEVCMQTLQRAHDDFDRSPVEDRDRNLTRFVLAVREQVAKARDFPQFVPTFERKVLLAGDRWMHYALPENTVDQLNVLLTAQDEMFLAWLGQLGAAGACVQIVVVDPASKPKSLLDDCGPDGYLDGLNTLIDRVAAWIGESGSASVDYYVCSRDIERRAGDRTMTTHDVDRLTQQGSLANANGREGTVPVSPWPSGTDRPFVQDYRARCHPGAVVADYVANRVYAALRPDRRMWNEPLFCPWRMLRSSIERDCRLPVSATILRDGLELRVPLAALTGRSARLVREAWTRGSADTFGLPSEDWRSDITTAWVQAARSS